MPHTLNPSRVPPAKRVRPHAAQTTRLRWASAHLEHSGVPSAKRRCTPSVIPHWPHCSAVCARKQVGQIRPPSVQCGSRVVSRPHEAQRGRVTPAPRERSSSSNFTTTGGAVLSPLVSASGWSRSQLASGACPPAAATWASSQSSRSCAGISGATRRTTSTIAAVRATRRAPASPTHLPVRSGMRPL